MAEPVTYLVSFITRHDGSEFNSDAPLQGSELLYYIPLQVRTTLNQVPDKPEEHWVPLSAVAYKGKVEGADAQKERTKAAWLSVERDAFLTSKDLLLIRVGKPYNWRNATTFIQGFIFRMSKKYGVGHTFQLRLQSREQTLENVEPALLDCFRIWKELEQRLGGKGTHRWESLKADKEIWASRWDSELTSIAFHTVFLPPAFDDRLVTKFPALLASPSTTSLAVLSFLFDLVRSGAGARALRLYSQTIPGESEPPGPVVKYQHLSYYLDGVAPHLRAATPPAFVPSLAAAITRTFDPLLALVGDGNTSPAEFVEWTIHALTLEAARLQKAPRGTAKLALSQVLERTTKELADAKGVKRPLLHVIVLGGGEVMERTLGELVWYLQSPTAHPYSTLNPQIGISSTSEALAWLNRPDLLKISIAEGRPSCSGVVLAQRLWKQMERNRERIKMLHRLADPFLDDEPEPVATAAPAAPPSAAPPVVANMEGVLSPLPARGGGLASLGAAELRRRMNLPQVNRGASSTSSTSRRQPMFTPLPFRGVANMEEALDPHLAEIRQDYGLAEPGEEFGGEGWEEYTEGMTEQGDEVGGPVPGEEDYYEKEEDIFAFLDSPVMEQPKPELKAAKEAERVDDLRTLLQDATLAEETAQGSKILLEVVTDAQLCKVVREAEAGFVLLVGVESIKASEDDAEFTAAMGSHTATALAKGKKNGKVLALAVSDLIYPLGTESYKETAGTKEQLIGGWAGAGVKEAEAFHGKAKKDELVFPNLQSETVPFSQIDALVTEAGLLNAKGVARLAFERKEAEERVWGKQ